MSFKKYLKLPILRPEKVKQFLFDLKGNGRGYWHRPFEIVIKIETVA
ncbi:MAG: hypothetical protein ORN25_10080 [Caulobacteraceae bacterium]|nr:hypothetical protein [Caulobacteraceae bacterium]